MFFPKIKDWKGKSWVSKSYIEQTLTLLDSASGSSFVVLVCAAQHWANKIFNPWMAFHTIKNLFVHQESSLPSFEIPYNNGPAVYEKNIL